MLVFGTIGIAIGIAYAIARIFKIQHKVSYLFIGIGAILPVLVDNWVCDCDVISDEIF